MTERLPRIWQKPLENAIHVDVCKNGDGNFRKTVVLNKKRQPTFDSWLGELSTCMKLRSGAVWRVYTPTKGHRVKDYECLEEGNVIVVAGQEVFKPLRYTDIDAYSQRKSPRRTNELPDTVRKIQASARHNKGNTKATIIKCWENGKGLCGCKQVLLPAKTNHPQTLDEVIDLVSKVLDFVVDKLFQMNGAKVEDVSEIVPNGCYVAAGARQKNLIRDKYSEGPLRAFDCSPHGRPKKLPSLHGKTSGHSSTEPSRNGSENDYSHKRRHRQLPPLSYSNKTSSQSSPEHSESSRNGSDTNDHSHRSRNRQRRRGPYQAREEESDVLTRPAKPRRAEKQRQTDYDQDNGGVFKARGQNRDTRGAQPVEDSRSTRTELPVDQRKAEEVMDEDLDRYSAHDDSMDEESGPHRTQQEPERTYRTNARRAHSPSNEEARKEKERQARLRREEEDRSRAEKQRQQQEAMLQRKREKEQRKKREEEERKRKQEEEEEKRKAERERERQRKEEERKKQKEKEREEEKKKAARKTSTPQRRQDTPQRQGTETLQDPHHNDAEKEEWAATKIQAGFRGYRDRRDLKNARADDKHSNLSETESIPILGEDDQDLGPGPDNDDDDRLQQEKAATKIQAGYRGAKARREVEVMRAEKAANEAANEAKDEEERAATKIQAGFRGARSRREVEAMRAEKAAKETRDREEKAATKIQAGFRGYKTRQGVNAMHAEKEI